MAQVKDAAIRKWQQIDASKKTMFFAVAGAAFVSGMAIVIALFLIQQITFHAKVWGAKQQTISTLRHNIDAVKELKNNVRALEANQALGLVKVKEENSPLQSVLDALPAEANADALGASLQTKFVGAVDGLSLESLTVTPSSEATDTDTTLQFSLSVSGSPEKLKELLTRFERSIRVISISSADIQAGDGRLTMNIRGQAHYEPAQHVNLETKVVKP